MSSEEQNPKYYLIIVGNVSRPKTLYAGSLEDKDTVKLSDPYDSILHMDILENDQLAVYASRKTETFRAVFDLTSFEKIEETVVAP
ncbi:MAG: hypothetical protein AAGL10_05190 [Pseudomonadota bacterium]